MDYFRQNISTPLGPVEVEASDTALISCRFLFEKPETNLKENEITEEACFQLQAYFKGQLDKFDLPLYLNGSEFQQRVWNELITIPFGKTSSYGRIATKLGDPNYVRAVGAANGRNPIGIIIPCHRVIGSGGSLVGYAGGLHRKKWLLEFEGSLTGGQLELF